MSFVVAIDPGLSGAIVFINDKVFMHYLMPLNDERDIDFDRLVEILNKQSKIDMVFLERAVPFAMGTSGAFTYGRGFAAIEIALRVVGLPVTYIEPARWTKEMHAGIEADLKPKAKSTIAVQRLYRKWLDKIPKSKNGKMHDGVVDALLIAGFGLRILNKK